MTETRRTYWDSPLEHTFTTRVLAAEPFQPAPFSDESRSEAASSPESGSEEPSSGERTACQFRLILEETLFHPEGGGQPSDVGVLLVEDRDLRDRLGVCELTVEKVLEEGNQIVHYVSVALPKPSPAGLQDSSIEPLIKPTKACLARLSQESSLPEEQVATKFRDPLSTHSQDSSAEPLAESPQVSSAQLSPESSSELSTEPSAVSVAPETLPETDPETLAKLLVGTSVIGVVDWNVRFDLMQQHTGQHILSRAFEELLDAKTVGFHLGEEYVSVDLAIDSLSEVDAARVEDRANEIVFSNVPVFAQEYEAGNFPDEIRTRLPISAENIRVVYVGDFDACACGGTHVTGSGQVGLVKINQIDRAHGGVRVVFRCGGRALKDYRQKERLLSETARTLSQPLTATPAAAIGLIEKAAGLEKALSETRKALLEQEILGMIREATVSTSSGSGSSFACSPGAGLHSPGTPVSAPVAVSPSPLVRHLPGKSVEELRMAAKRVSEAIKAPSAFFTITPRFQAVVASPSSEPDARAVTAQIAAELGGRGGGTPQFAQVGSKEPLQKGEKEVVAAIIEALKV